MQDAIYILKNDDFLFNWEFNVFKNHIYYSNHSIKINSKANFKVNILTFQEFCVSLSNDKKEIFHLLKVRCWLAWEWYGTLKPSKIYPHNSWICCVTKNIFISTHHTKYTLSCQEIKPNNVIELFIFTLAQALHQVWFIWSVATCKHTALSPE